MQVIQMKGSAPLGTLGAEGYITPCAEFEKGWRRQQPVDPMQPHIRVVDFSRFILPSMGVSILKAVKAAPCVGSVALNKISGGINGVGAEVIYDVWLLKGELADLVSADPDRYRISPFVTGNLRHTAPGSRDRECYDIDIIAVGIFDTHTKGWAQTIPLKVPKVQAAMKELQRKRAKAREKIAARAAKAALAEGGAP